MPCLWCVSDGEECCSELGPIWAFSVRIVPEEGSVDVENMLVPQYVALGGHGSYKIAGNGAGGAVCVSPHVGCFESCGRVRGKRPEAIRIADPSENPGSFDKNWVLFILRATGVRSLDLTEVKITPFAQFNPVQDWVTGEWDLRDGELTGLFLASPGIKRSFSINGREYQLIIDENGLRCHPHQTARA